MTVIWYFVFLLALSLFGWQPLLGLLALGFIVQELLARFLKSFMRAHAHLPLGTERRLQGILGGRRRTHERPYLKILR